MVLQILPATIADLPDLAVILSKALSKDPFVRAMIGSNCSFEDECRVNEETIRPRLEVGVALGEAKIWKVVNEEGESVAFAGLHIPVPLSEEELFLLRPKMGFPPGGNQKLQEFMANEILKPSLARNGFDSEKHFQRQMTMVLPEYQRQGIGRMINDKLNAIADESDKETFVRARPGIAALLVQMGYETLERIDFDLADFGVELNGQDGKTAIFVMKRLPRAKEEKGKTLDWAS